MATGITIDEVTNTLDDIQGTEKIPVSSGGTDPEVVTTGDLKTYINDGMQAEISDLSTIRSGAAAGATAYQKPLMAYQRLTWQVLCRPHWERQTVPCRVLLRQTQLFHHGQRQRVSRLILHQRWVLCLLQEK